MAGLGHCLCFSVPSWKCHSSSARQLHRILPQRTAPLQRTPGIAALLQWWRLLETDIVRLRWQAPSKSLSPIGPAAPQRRDRGGNALPLGLVMHLQAVADTGDRGSAHPDADTGDTRQERQKQLWEDLFLHPAEWWDNRMDKRGPRRPDFRHKSSGEGLWLSNLYKPQWVISRLASLDTQMETGLRGLRGVSKSDDVLQSFCLEGQLDRALEVLMSLDEQSTVTSEQVYGSLLKVCTQKKSLAQAKRVYAHLAKHGLETNMFLGEYVVSTFVKCGGLEDALQVFQRLPCRSVFSWTALISGYTTSGQGHEALRVYQRMQEEGVQPNAYTFSILLRACARMVDLEEGKRIHSEAVKYGCAADSFVASCLVDMYWRCGSIADAQNVFEGLFQCDVVPWNVMLSAHVEQGQPEKCLQLYERLRKEGVTPSHRTFVSALQACVMLAEKEEARAVNGLFLKFQCLKMGKEIHSHACREGYGSDMFVGSTLISLYGKCGSVVEAQSVFDGLSQLDVVSWNAMIGAYVEQGQAEEALQLYDQMCKEGVSLSSRTFVTVFQACGMLAEKEDLVLDEKFIRTKVIERGRALHAAAQRKGFDSDVFVTSTLITMYAKCRSMIDAQNLFDGLSQRDGVLWNTLIAAYVEQGDAKKSLQLYEQLLEEGVSPSSRVFVSALQACGMLAEQENMGRGSTKVNFLAKGKAIHSCARRKGCDSDIFVGNTLVSMYGKCGSITDAQAVFDGLSQHNVVSYNAMLAAYIEQDQADEVFQLYEHMREECVSPNDRTFVSILQGCGILAGMQDDGVVEGHPIRVRYGKIGKVIHAEVVRKCFDSHLFVTSTLLSMYGKCGSLEDALAAFNRSSHKDIVLWNAMLAACVEQGHGEYAFGLYQKLREEGVRADARTFVSALQACGILAQKEDDVMVDGQTVKVNYLQKGKAIQADAWVMGCDSDVFVGSTLVGMYGKCGSILDAQNAFDGLAVQDVVSWNAMLAAFIEQGLDDQALQLYRHMQEEGAIADDITLVWVLQACSNTGAWSTIWQIHQNLVIAGSSYRPFVASALITAYGRCSSMMDAQLVFDSLPQPDIVSWNALIAGYARQGNCVASMHWYEKMQVARVHPNGITFLSLLYACSHAGLLDEGVKYLESMSRKYGVTPEMKHYVSMVDLFGRAGCFTRIEELLSTMPMQPSLTVWLCLLGACQKHGKVELAEHAFDSAVQLQPKNPAAYVLMANIYSEAGLLDKASEVTNLREKAGAWKKPGQSWMEYDHKVHTFVVGDCKVKELQPLYDLLGMVS